MADLRVAEAADAERLGRQFAAGVEVYLEFASPGWSLPSAEGEAAHLLAHLRNLIVDRSHWGSGLARELHAAAVEAARERGFRAIRLFTPSAHARARRFYEREGWAAVGEEFHDPAPDLVLLEYRLTL